jgi:hypothetical protein
VSDLTAPDAASRAAYDDLHRVIDPSHVRALLASELEELVHGMVGPIGGRETPDPIRLPIALILTDVADRAEVFARLDAELEGGAPTGFQPVRDGDDVVVSFVSAVVRARRAS